MSKICIIFILYYISVLVFLTISVSFLFLSYSISQYFEINKEDLEKSNNKTMDMKIMVA